MTHCEVKSDPMNLVRAIILRIALLDVTLASDGICAADLTAIQPVSFGEVRTPSNDTVTFEMDIQPLLTRFGCTAGACHGKSRGQNGFALSLLGFDSEFDYSALVLEGRGRRVFSASPETSLLLQKATGLVPHGGGVRFESNGPSYDLIRRWILAGTPRTPEKSAQLERVLVKPTNRSLAPRESFPLRVLAEYSDGTTRDVTDASAFQSNDRAVAAVSPEGVIQAGPVPGESAVMVRYMNHIAVCAVTIPLSGNVSDDVYDSLPRSNEIDEHVWNKLKLLRMLPSEVAGDATFHRRAFLRAIGRFPTSEETRAFLTDTTSDKRHQLVDRLLDHHEYADFWANKWADLLRPNPFRVGIKPVLTFDAWLRDIFRNNVPYDQFVRQLVTARGDTWINGATVLFRDRREAVEIGSSVSQLFLGIRIECAKCHHHPFEVWSQDDFYGFASFFSRVGRTGELTPPISGGREIVFSTRSGQLKHGRTGEPVAPKTLIGPPLQINREDDPREMLVQWMTDPANPFFAKVMANRVWAEMMGQGLVEPVDDIRATNPASNEPLLKYLANDFRLHGYDIKHLIRRIMKSHAFNLSSTPVERNVADIKNFSRYYRQRLRAEVLLDGVNDVLGTEEEFVGMPPGSRASQLWTYRSSSLFLDTFGRPDANQDPPCERTSDFTTPQVLHLMNSPALNKKLALDTATPARLAASERDDVSLLDEIFLRVYCRFPTTTERTRLIVTLPTSENRRSKVEDLFWALMNTPEFFFID